VTKIDPRGPTSVAGGGGFDPMSDKGLTGEKGDLEDWFAKLESVSPVKERLP